MALATSAQQWASWNWTSKAVGSPGLRLSEAFSAFAAVVNATPANAALQLQVVKDHNSASGVTNFGYVWRLGHPVNPVLLSFYNTSKVQGYNASSSTALLRLGLESAYTIDSSNGGYGTFASTLHSVSAGLSHYAADGSPAIDYGAMLLVLMDTAPGREFFCYSIAPIGADTYTQNHTMVLFRSPATSGWNVFFNRSNAYVGMFYSQNSYIWNNNTLVSCSVMPYALGGVQQLSQGYGLYANPTSGLFQPGTIQPRVVLPDCLWLGDNQLSSPRRLGRVSSPAGGGTFYQLAAAYGGATDLWFLQPTGTPAALALWSTVGSLPWETVPDRLSFCPLAPLQALGMGPAAAPDFLTDWSMSALGAAGVRQHPFYAKQLQGSGGGGGGSRPSSGVLWPRGTS
ncbi:hypothetical protein [Cyanobium sp. ATX 6F1]|uniref:hypothetical protein n=1 Tax=unclassified Cyanobium TaxID=2627006 RepID=UPI0020CDB681|nr:hypothetical protein [Cyanobium sp. ATX 6F1]MCP9915239.1 hypothetical protein [Cyanobium sp. ATX 6F1]